MRPRPVYDAAMRVARWRWVLVLMMVLIAGCVPSAMRGLPASFEDDLREGGWTFAPATPGPDAMPSGAVVGEMRQHSLYGAWVESRAIPIYGFLGCTLVACPASGGPSGGPWGNAPGTVWLILYPDSAVPGGEIAWVLVDGVAGYDSDRHVVHGPEPRP